MEKKYTAVDLTSATLHGIVFTLFTIMIINQFLGV